MFVHPRLSKTLSKAASALVCAAAIFGAGCHGPNNISDFGIAWVSVTAEPAPQYASYVVTIDSITLTRSDNTVYAAVATPELVDLTQINNFAELWSSGAIPNGTYIAATITVDYTPVSAGGSSVIAVRKGNVPVIATVLDAQTKAMPGTYALTVVFDPANQPTITPTFASTSAALMAVDIDLPGSGYIDTSTATPTVYVRPYMTIGHQPSDTKLIRVRGPLANSSVNVDTYTAFIRPFYDEANNLGQLTLFSQPSTIYTLNGVGYVGNAGLNALSVLSAGSTMTAGFTTFQPDYNPLNGAFAGRFNLQYVIAGSTLEDIYTNGISGDVIARDGNTLTVRGATIIFTTDDTFGYEVADCNVILGAGTLVTADDNPLLKNLTPSSIAVGDHITARGNYKPAPAGQTCGAALFGEGVYLDSTGVSAQNTGSVRLQPNEAFGTLVSSAAGSLVMDLTSIDYWPVATYNFAGNGVTTPVPAAFSVNTEGLALPAGTAPGDPIWLSGYASYFGEAPPDYLSFALNNELSVQTAGGSLGGAVPTTPGSGGCGLGSQVCDPAVLSVNWGAGTTTTPFTSINDHSFTIDLANTKIVSATIQIGPETILMSSLPSSPTVVPTTLASTETFAPRYSWGNPVTSAATESQPTSTTNLKISSVFSEFASGALTGVTSTDPALQLVARGIYDRATNTFTATAIDFAL
jgi:hypothetical protein